MYWDDSHDDTHSLIYMQWSNMLTPPLRERVNHQIISVIGALPESQD